MPNNWKESVIMDIAIIAEDITAFLILAIQNDAMGNLIYRKQDYKFICSPA